MKKFRIWYKTEYGVGIEIKKAKDISLLKLTKKVDNNLIEIEEIDTKNINIKINQNEKRKNTLRTGIME